MRSTRFFPAILALTAVLLLPSLPANAVTASPEPSSASPEPAPAPPAPSSGAGISQLPAPSPEPTPSGSLQLTAAAKSIVGPNLKLRVKVTGGKGQNLMPQRWNGTAWVNTTTRVYAVHLSGSHTWVLPYTFSVEGSPSLRVVLHGGGRPTVVSNVVLASYRRAATTVRLSWSTLFDKHMGKLASYRQATDRVTLYPRYSTRYGYFQELRSGSWVTISRLTFPFDPSRPGQAVSQYVRTPSTSASVSKKYRVVISQTTAERAWSAYDTIQHSNPRHLTGLAGDVYKIMRGWCPNVSITLRSDAGYYAWPNNWIDISRNLSYGAPMKYIALHECAHALQFDLYSSVQPVGSHWTNGVINERLNRYYPGGTGEYGLERIADCMAMQMGVPPSSTFYTSYCNAGQNYAARMILAGKKP